MYGCNRFDRQTHPGKNGEYSRNDQYARGLTKAGGLFPEAPEKDPNFSGDFFWFPGIIRNQLENFFL
jgi:hypothetical protein